MLSRILVFIFNLPVIKQLIALLDRLSFPGFPEVSLLEVARQFRTSLTSSRISMRAAAVSFNFFMAIFPSIIFLFTLIAYLPIDDFQFKLLSALQSVLPETSYLAVRNTILDIISQQRGGLLSAGVLIAMFYSTNGVKSIIDSFNASSITEDKRPVWKVLLVSLSLTLILIVLLVLAISLMLFTNLALDWLIQKNLITYGFSYVLIVLGKWLFFYALLFFTVAFLYYLGPPHENRVQFFSIGAIATSLCMLILIVGFGFFVSRFGTYNTIYGSVGALIVVLVLVNLISHLLLAGYEFNVGVKHLSKQSAN